MKLFEVAEPFTIKEASKTGKVRHKFWPGITCVPGSIVAVSLQADLGTVEPLYLLGNIQTGKSKKKFEFSQADQVKQKSPPQPLLIKGTSRREKGRKNLGTSTFFHGERANQ